MKANAEGRIIHIFHPWETQVASQVGRNFSNFATFYSASVEVEYRTGIKARIRFENSMKMSKVGRKRKKLKISALRDGVARILEFKLNLRGDHRKWKFLNGDMKLRRLSIIYVGSKTKGGLPARCCIISGIVTWAIAPSFGISLTFVLPTRNSILVPTFIHLCAQPEKSSLSK